MMMGVPSRPNTLRIWFSRYRLIGEVEELFVVAEHDEVGRLDADLRHIIDLQAAALVRGGLDPGRWRRPERS